MPWTVKDKLQNLFEVGDYEFRLEEVTYRKPKENSEYGSISFTWVVVGGDHDKKKQFQSFPLNPDYVGLLATALAGTGQFGQEGPGEEPEELPDDGETLARTLNSRLGGKVYDVTYKHRLDKKTGKYWPDISINGLSQAAFR